MPHLYRIFLYTLSLFYLLYLLHLKCQSDPKAPLKHCLSWGLFLIPLGENNFSFLHFYLRCYHSYSSIYYILLNALWIQIINHLFKLTLLKYNVHIIRYSHCLQSWCITHLTTNQSAIDYFYHHRFFCHAVSPPLPYKFLHWEMTNLVSIIWAYFVNFRVWTNPIVQTLLSLFHAA